MVRPAIRPAIVRGHRASASSLPLPPSLMKALGLSIALCCLFLMTASLSAADPKPNQPNPKPHTVDSLETIQKRLKDDKAVLYDVREEWEWKEGHLSQAELLPLSELGKKLREPEYVQALEKKLPVDKPIYIHCKSGGRCALAAEALRKELGPDYDFRPLKQGYDALVTSGFIAAESKK